MRKTLHAAACLLIACAALTLATERQRNWQNGTLIETEKQQVRQGSTKMTNSEIDAKDKKGKTQYSGTSTSTETENYDDYQVYTIETDGATYVAREKLLFPWSKPAATTIGSKVQFAVEKNTLYLLGNDGKQHKAGIVKASMKPKQ